MGGVGAGDGGAGTGATATHSPNIGRGGGGSGGPTSEPLPALGLMQPRQGPFAAPSAISTIICRSLGARLAFLISQQDVSHTLLEVSSSKISWLSCSFGCLYLSTIHATTVCGATSIMVLGPS